MTTPKNDNDAVTVDDLVRGDGLRTALGDSSGKTLGVAIDRENGQARAAEWTADGRLLRIGGRPLPGSDAADPGALAGILDRDDRARKNAEELNGTKGRARPKLHPAPNRMGGEIPRDARARVFHRMELERRVMEDGGEIVAWPRKWRESDINRAVERYGGMRLLAQGEETEIIVFDDSLLVRGPDGLRVASLAQLPELAVRELREIREARNQAREEARANRERPEFPLYVDAQGNEHEEF